MQRPNLPSNKKSARPNKKAIMEVASPKTVQNYWKNQNSHKTATSKWTDEIFPPNRNSILGLDKNGRFIDQEAASDEITMQEIGDVNTIVWKRATELVPNAELFVDGIEATDIQQGGLGTCYYLSAIAAVC